MIKKIKETIIYILLCSFLPMAFALIITKITKEGWNNLGIAFHLKSSWNMYLLSILSTVILVYLSYPLMILCFPNQVTTSFSLENISQICLMALLGTACLIECLGEKLGWIGYLFTSLEGIMGTVASCVAPGIIRGVYHIGVPVLMEYPTPIIL